jgi:hypothetical protein
VGTYLSPQADLQRGAVSRWWLLIAPSNTAVPIHSFCFCNRSLCLPICWGFFGEVAEFISNAYALSCFICSQIQKHLVDIMKWVFYWETSPSSYQYKSLHSVSPPWVHSSINNQMQTSDRLNHSWGHWG